MAFWADGFWADGFWAPGFWAGEAVGEAPTITTTSLADGFVGVPYSRTLVATGATPIAWDIPVGTLPDGLSLDLDTGEISGTPTTEEEQTFTARATNAEGEDTQVLVLEIRILAIGDGTGRRRVGLGLGL